MTAATGGCGCDTDPLYLARDALKQAISLSVNVTAAIFFLFTGQVV